MKMTDFKGYKQRHVLKKVANAVKTEKLYLQNDARFDNRAIFQIAVSQSDQSQSGRSRRSIPVHVGRQRRRRR